MWSPDALCALAAFFILGMTWLRTRMQYPRGLTERHALTAAGAGYFLTLALLMAAGWFAAPLIARRTAPTALLGATLLRGVWFLAVYYLSIPLHRALLRRGRPVFS
jgi:hypothetical protein